MVVEIEVTGFANYKDAKTFVKTNKIAAVEENIYGKVTSKMKPPKRVASIANNSDGSDNVSDVNNSKSDVNSSVRVDELLRLNEELVAEKAILEMKVNTMGGEASRGRNQGKSPMRRMTSTERKKNKEEEAAELKRKNAELRVYLHLFLCICLEIL